MRNPKWPLTLTGLLALSDFVSYLTVSYLQRGNALLGHRIGGHYFFNWSGRSREVYQIYFDQSARQWDSVVILSVLAAALGLLYLAQQPRQTIIPVRATPDAGENPARAAWNPFALCVFAVDFLSFVITAYRIGGIAMLGHQGGGHYFLGAFGTSTEVPRGWFEYSSQHGIAQFHGIFAIITGAVLLALRFRPRTAPEERARRALMPIAAAMQFPKWIVYAAFALAAVNFISFLLIDQMIGGNALNGYQSHGHYFLGDNGVYKQTGRMVFEYSWWHGNSVFVTGPLAVLTVLAWVAQRKINDALKG